MIMTTTQGFRLVQAYRLLLAAGFLAGSTVAQPAAAAVSIGFSGHWGTGSLVEIGQYRGVRHAPWPLHRTWIGPRYHAPHFSIGVWVPFLPIGYATYWYGGAPYYVYDDVYYVTDGRGYRVVERPTQKDASLVEPGPAPVVAAPPANSGPTPVYEQQARTGQLYAYPMKGQSDTTATFDRIECETWGSKQTGYYPDQSVNDENKKADYRRAVVACLEGRGYSVR